MKIKPPLPTVSLTNARALRRAMTDAERVLWRCLRSNQLQGFKFRRQHAIPPYIADFCCIDAALIIELDGSQHEGSSDHLRTQWLQARGWTVLRFWNNDVLLSLDAVIEAISNTIATPYPHPNPLPMKGTMSRWKRGLVSTSSEASPDTPPCTTTSVT